MNLNTNKGQRNPTQWNLYIKATQGPTQCGAYTQVVFLFRFNNMENIEHLVFIYRWSLEQVWLQGFIKVSEYQISVHFNFSSTVMKLQINFETKLSYWSPNDLEHWGSNVPWRLKFNLFRSTISLLRVQHAHAFVFEKGMVRNIPLCKKPSCNDGLCKIKVKIPWVTFGM